MVERRRKEGRRRREGGGKREEKRKERERRIAERIQEGGEGRGRVSCGPFQGEQCISQHSSHDNVLECRHYIITFNIYIQINCLHINKCCLNVNKQHAPTYFMVALASVWP